MRLFWGRNGGIKDESKVFFEKTCMNDKRLPRSDPGRPGRPADPLSMLRARQCGRIMIWLKDTHDAGI